MSLEIALQKVIKDWLLEGKSRNLKSLSRQTDLSYPTIRRIYKLEGQPLITTVVRVLNVCLGTADKTKGFLTEWMPDYSAYLDHDADSNTVYIPVQNANPFHVAIVRDVTFSSLTKQALLEKHGLSAVPALEQLLSSGVLVEINNVIELKHYSTYIPTQEFAKESAKQIAENTDINLQGNIIDTSFELLTLEDSRDLYNAFLDFKAELARLKAKKIKGGGTKKIAYSINLTMY